MISSLVSGLLRPVEALTDRLTERVGPKFGLSRFSGIRESTSPVSKFSEAQGAEIFNDLKETRGSKL